MLKRERMFKILEMINSQGIVTVNEIMENMKVSDMTVRRDLDELEKAGKVIRFHGGAQSITHSIALELSHQEKSKIEIEKKERIAKVATSHIKEGETIFLGPGTTIEALANQLLHKPIRVVTTNYSAFEALRNSNVIDLILIGGEYRKKTGTFVGPITNHHLINLKFTKAFISANGIYNDAVSTSSIEEGEYQRIVLNNSRTKYLLADSTKLNKEDFYTFYNLSHLDYLMTDEALNKDVKAHYEQYVTVLVAN